MKLNDPARAHQEAMVALQHEYERKMQYHRQKSFHDPAEIYWLAHDFLSSLLQRTNSHHTEEELGLQLQALKHDFISLPEELIDAWRIFLGQLAFAQYGGGKNSPEQAKMLLDQCAALIDETLREIVAAPDEITKKLAVLKVLVSNGDIERAEKDYRAILSHYETLDETKKKLHYHRIASAHKSILSARSARPVAQQL